MSDYEKFSALLRYDKETGKLFWRQSKMGRQIFKPAGHKDKTGYTRIMIDYKMYLAHRIIWLLSYKEWPKEHLDHIDRNPDNNKLENLRDVGRSMNMRNAKARKDNCQGHRGISLNPNGRYYVRLQGKYIGSSYFLDKAIKMRDNYNETN